GLAFYILINISFSDSVQNMGNALRVRTSHDGGQNTRLLALFGDFECALQAFDHRNTRQTANNESCAGFGSQGGDANPSWHALQLERLQLSYFSLDQLYVIGAIQGIAC